MKQTALQELIKELKQFKKFPMVDQPTIDAAIEFAELKLEMEKQQKKDAYQHGRDDENCALSDGAMAPDYENADEWYQGEYGGDK